MRNYWLIVVMLALGPVPGLAAQCVASVSALMFGDYYQMRSTPLEVNANVGLSCSAGEDEAGGQVPYRITLTTGNSASYSERQMRDTGGFNVVRYNVFSEPSKQPPWGDGSGGSVAVFGSVRLAEQGMATATATHMVYGVMPALQDSLPGDYGDVLVVTVSY